MIRCETGLFGLAFFSKPKAIGTAGVPPLRNVVRRCDKINQIQANPITSITSIKVYGKKTYVSSRHQSVNHVLIMS